MKAIRSLKLRELVFLILLVICFVIGGLFVGSQLKETKLDPQILIAAVTNPSPASSGYYSLVLPISLTMNSTNDGTGVYRFKMPWPATLVGVSASVQNTGSGNTVTFDVTEGGVSVLSAPITANETTVTEGTISDSAIADEATIGINMSVTTSTNCKGPMLQLNFKRK
jgi:hypothetical protein